MGEYRTHFLGWFRHGSRALKLPGCLAHSMMNRRGNRSNWKIFTRLLQYLYMHRTCCENSCSKYLRCASVSTESVNAELVFGLVMMTVACECLCVRGNNTTWYQRASTYQQVGFSLGQESANFFTRGPLKAITQQFEGRTSHVMWLFLYSGWICYILPNQQMFRKYVIFYYWQNLFGSRWNGFEGRME